MGKEVSKMVIEEPLLESTLHRHSNLDSHSLTNTFPRVKDAR
jgi:hypothetical protein